MTTIYHGAAQDLSDKIDAEIVEMLTLGEEFTIRLQTPVSPE